MSEIDLNNLLEELQDIRLYIEHLADYEEDVLSIYSAEVLDECRLIISIMKGIQ